MDPIGLGWRTDLAVLAGGGSSIERREDHLIVRTPANPAYHWGNFVMVIDPAAVDDAERWRAVFAESFPGAGHVAIGLVARPDPEPWAGTGIESSEVLVSDRPVVESPLPLGYQVRALTAEAEWAASTALNDGHYPGEPEFARLRSLIRSRMVSAGRLTWFGAFTADDQLVSELGIAPVDEGTARYQSVLTHAAHRRRGLTRHLLAVAAAHARSGGAETLVIVTDPDSDAGRLYRSAGFRYAETSWQAYSAPSAAIA